MRLAGKKTEKIIITSSNYTEGKFEGIEGRGGRRSRSRSSRRRSRSRRSRRRSRRSRSLLLW